VSMRLVSGSERLAIIELSSRQWRVTDPLKEERDGSGVVGFVERAHRRYEVIALEAPHERRTFESLDDAIASLS
jgi:hypothetical protein